MKDHLGNTRLMFCDRNGDGVIKPENAPEASEVTQENSYYAFGMNMEFGTWENTPSVTDNLHQYNGKELNTDFGLNWNDYGRRMYDPAISRFVVMDRFAEKYASINPYQYGKNNPLNFIDIQGDSVIPIVSVSYDFKKGTTPALPEDLGLTSVKCDDVTVSVGDNGEPNIYVPISEQIHPDMKPNSNSEIDKKNPGLSEEVHKHEEGHGQQKKEDFARTITYPANSKEYKGTIEKILTDILKDVKSSGSSLDSKLLNNIAGQLVQKAVLSNPEHIGQKGENDANRRVKESYPVGTKLYSTGDKPIIYPK